MVVLSDIVNTFWGVTLNTGKWYTQTVDKSFHISMAAIIPSQDSKHAGPVSVMLKHHGDEFLLCTLMQNKIYQQTLDLNFSEHEEITLYIKGKGCVHLTGYLIPDDDIMDMDEEDDDDELDDVDYIEGDQMDSEASLADNSDSEESSTDDRELVEAGETLDADDDDEDAPRLTFLKDMASDESDLDSDEEPDVDSNDEESDDEASDEESMETASPMASGKRKKNQDSSKKLKKQKQANGHEFILDEAEEDEDQVDDSFEQTPSKKSKNRQKKLKQAQDSAKKQSENKSNSNKNSQSVTKDGGRTPTTKANTKKDSTPPAKGKSPKAKGNTPEVKGKKPKNTTSGTKPVKRVLAGSVVCEDLQEGHGPMAKSGKTVHVYYCGKLISGKTFDSTLSGRPFKFKLGKQEVIKGWDIGIEGMKVGGKRKITIPPKMAYGNTRAGDIPPNSPLVFDVELKAVS